MKVYTLTTILAVIFSLGNCKCLGDETFLQHAEVMRQKLESALGAALGIKPEELHQSAIILKLVPKGQSAVDAKVWINSLAKRIPDAFGRKLVEAQDELGFVIFVEDDKARWELGLYLYLDEKGNVYKVFVHHAQWG